MDHFTLALMTGAVAGALDIIPMIYGGKNEMCQNRRQH